MPSPWACTVPMTLYLSLITSVGEELLFRGFLFGALKVGRTLWTAVIVSTLLSLLVHEDVRTIGSTLTLGLLFSWLRGISGSAWPACLAHASFFALPVARLLLLRPGAEDDYSPTWRIGGAVLAIVSGVILSLTLPRARRAESARHADG